MSKAPLTRRDAKLKKIKLVLLLLVLLVLIFIGLKVIENYEFRPQRKEEDAFTPSSTEDTLIYEGREYTRNKNIDSVLVVGVDKYEGQTTGLVKNNERADFILLLAIDKVNKTYKALHINRDSMANVRELGIKGDVAGYKQMQITLSHTYGDGGQTSALNTKYAVENLLYGMNIDHYIVYKMDAVTMLTEEMGGILVPSLAGYSVSDAQKQNIVETAGGFLLKGSSALSFVRYRDMENMEGNLDRMNRQQIFLSALKDQTQQRIEEDESFLANISLDFSKYMLSDLSIYDLNDYAQILTTAEDTDIKEIDGKYIVGTQYLEYYCSEDSVKESIIELFYE